MIYTVDMTQPTHINFTPETVEEEVSQNIRTILTTPRGSAPLARGIGLDYTIIDEPASIAESRLIAEVITAITEQEPRASVSEISFKDDIKDSLNGCLAVVVKYTLVEEE
ncbi:lysozyme [Paenibacillus riograndensis]|uniref:Lysozyme n=1 Tax=Paenibacillus riograndensis TaxID=483937 RepID=A0A132U5D5_9BACL|nr:GPW/gp25 family protein [Paenibacillus riograndensis]KWX78668.1 lysozyme [Paenibacillus riograndensis]